MEAGHIYHIYNRGVSHVRIFPKAKNNHFFLRRLREYTGDQVELLAFCLMPTHFHLLIRVKWVEDQNEYKIDQERQKLKSAFRHFLTSYAKAINRQERRHGALFQRSYKRKRVTSERQFAYTIAYIHYNPVAAGYTSSLTGWRFSSYADFLHPAGSHLARQWVLDWFGGLEAFKAFHEDYMDSKLRKS